MCPTYSRFCTEIEWTNDQSENIIELTLIIESWCRQRRQRRAATMLTTNVGIGSNGSRRMKLSNW
jgi:hypothetical protein